MSILQKIIGARSERRAPDRQNRFLRYRFLPGAALFVLSLLSAASSAVPTSVDFQRTLIADGLDLPLAFEISTDGRVFVISKCGGLYVWQLDGGVAEQTSVVPNVRCGFEDGLLSVALDPNFTENNYIYFQYTAPGSLTRVSRFVVNPNNSLDVSSESILLQWVTGNEAHGHMGGDMAFDLDGNLLISTGDNMAASGYFAPGAQASSGNTNDLRGKILRITPTAEGGYTIPEGNLFAGDALRRPEIYGMGFRNPFRMGMDPQTGYFYVGDIGPDASAAGPEGPMGMDEIHRISSAGNFGWPYVIGANEPYAGYDPYNLVNNYQHNTGATNLPDAEPAIWTILHRAIMAGPVYRYDESIDNQFKFPEYYDGKLIFWDFNSSRFFTLDTNEAQPQAIDLPIDTAGFQGAIDAKLDPRTQQLYVLQWGSGCCDMAPHGNGALYRFDYIGDREAGINLAIGSIATASSHLGGNVAANAVDGNPETRWESEFSDPQTLNIDLQQESVIDSIVLVWEAAYSSEYTIEASLDGVLWDLLVDANDGNGGTRLHLVNSQNLYRYVRLTGTARGTGYGHSLFEVQIFAGEADGPPEELTEFAYLNMPRTLDHSFTGVPLLLSETGAFSDTANLVPSENLLPFSPNSQLWSDRAKKVRWLSLPADTRIDWHATQDWSYPQGTVAVKHFELPLDDNNPSAVKRLETRLLVMQANGRVYGVTYKWREDNSDADLLTASLLEDLSILDSDGASWTQTWAYPGPGECIDCHTPGSAQILGLSTRQLNGDFDYPGMGVENQLAHWNNLNLFSPGFSNAQIQHFDKAVAITDSSASLEHRIKSYLDTNCASCHGTGSGGSQWDARFNTPLSEMRIVDEQTTGIRNYFNYYGLENAKVVASGSPHDSILFIRDKSTDPTDRMPPIGRSLEHKEYIEVLEQWIESLESSSGPGPGPAPVPASEGKVATASSSDGDNLPSLAIDGDSTTYWASGLSSSPWLQVDLKALHNIDQIVLNWASDYGASYTIQASSDSINWVTLVVENNGVGGTETFQSLSGQYRYIRLRGAASDTPYRLALYELQVFGEPLPISLNRLVTTSTNEGGLVRARAVDGDPTTLWLSEFADSQWIEIDLEAVYDIDRIVLDWEAYYQSGYQIQGSVDRISWSTIAVQQDESGCMEEHTDLSGSYRYIRLTRAPVELDWGYGLWQFAVYGQAQVTIPDPGTPVIPEITINSPSAGQQFLPTSAVSLTVAISDNSWFASGGGYRYSLNGGAAVQVTQADAINLGTLAEGSYTLQVTLIDDEGEPLGQSQTVNFSVQSAGGETPPTPSPAQLNPVGAVATSNLGANTAASAIDGNLSSRWESEFSDPQTITLDLGESVYFTRAVLHWEGAFARSYTLDVSEDGESWQMVYSTENGNGGVDDLPLDGQQGRYIRMHGTERATVYGYSLWEFEVYGVPAEAGLPMISIESPNAGASFPETESVAFQVNISSEAWLASGGSYNYTLNNNEAVQVNHLNPVELGILPTGRHVLRVSLVDSQGSEVSIPRTREFTVNCGDQCPSVLVFSKTNGFRHDSIPVGIAMVEDIGDAYGYTVTASEDASLFTAENLAQYTTIVFMNTTGDIFDDAQKAAFRAYIEGGGGYVGLHSAADTEHGWSWYTQTLLGGARFIHHGDGIPHARVEIEQPDHPTMDHIGSEWHIHEEWYFWESNPRNTGNVEVLANLDRSSYPSNYPVEDHPVVFTNVVGSGRVFYTAKGHVDATFADPRMIEKIRKAIEWTSQH